MILIIYERQPWRRRPNKENFASKTVFEQKTRWYLFFSSFISLKIPDFPPLYKYGLSSSWENIGWPSRRDCNSPCWMFFFKFPLNLSLSFPLFLLLSHPPPSPIISLFFSLTRVLLLSFRIIFMLMSNLLHFALDVYMIGWFHFRWARLALFEILPPEIGRFSCNNEIIALLSLELEIQYG